MKPLLLKGPILNDIWGGSYLRDNLGIEMQSETASAMLALNAQKSNPCIIRSGELGGLSLYEAINSYGEDILGKASAKKGLPFCVSIIDSAERTPMEVSSGDRLWYILDCAKDAAIISGFSKKMTALELEKQITSNNISSICRFTPVKKGETYFIPAGTVYAAGKNIAFVEIATAKCETYCVNDYSRIYPDGSRKAVDIKQALSLIKQTAIPKVSEDDTTLFPFGTVKTLGCGKGFNAELLELDGNAGLFDRDNFSVVLITQGSAIVSYPSGNLSLKKGELVLLPPAVKIILTGRAQLMNIHI